MAIGCQHSFLNGEVQEEVYIDQSLRLEINHNPSLVCRLDKALYVLRQTPRAWFAKLHNTLLNLGFASAKFELLLFVRFTAYFMTYLLVYVVNILKTGNDQNTVHTLIQQLHCTFALKDLGHVHLFLGVQVTLCLMGVSISPMANTLLTC